MNTETLLELYKLLDLDSSATLDQVRQKYRDLVFVWHPDRFTGNSRLQSEAENKFKIINNAYERLIEFYKNNNSGPIYNGGSSCGINNESNCQSTNGTLYAVYLHNKTGYMNVDGDMVIPVMYTRGPEYFDDVAVVWYGNSVLVINGQNQILYELNQEKYNLRYIDNIYVLTDKQISKEAILNNQFELCGTWCDKIGIYDRTYNNMAYFENNGKHGLLNLTGDEVFPAKYDNVYINQYYINLKSDCCEQILRTDNLKLINVPKGMDSRTRRIDHHDTIFVYGESGEGLIDLDGNIVIEPGKYSDISPYSCGLARCSLEVNTKDGKNKLYQFINTSGDIAIELGDWREGKYGEVGYHFTNDMCNFTKCDNFKFFGGQKYTSGLIDTNGNIANILFSNDDRKLSSMNYSRYNNSYCIVTTVTDKINKGKFGLIKDGMWIIDCKYDSMYECKGSVYVSKIGDSHIYYDGNGKIIKLKI